MKHHVMDQKQLFLYNRSSGDALRRDEILDAERRWVDAAVSAREVSAQAVSSRAELFAALRDRLEEERASPLESAAFVADGATLTQFKVIVAEFAVDGLTEAESFLPIVQRLPFKAQMAVLRVLIDEFGGGNADRAHSQLYRDLLSELRMPLDINGYLDEINEESFAFSNIFYWLVQRAPRVEYFLGALAYLESSVPISFGCFSAACDRLGIASSLYYTEHIHIDQYHARELKTAIREVEDVAGIDFRKVWVGVDVASAILAQAFEAAVDKARRVQA
ncbi:iron-containing redox enzyme family protein [Sorangium sp. So ce1128]